MIVDQFAPLLSVLCAKIITAIGKTKLVVPEEYWSQYKRARLTFRHHIVYDPQTKVCGFDRCVFLVQLFSRTVSMQSCF